MTTRPTFQRARRPEQKERRHEDILRAARYLAGRDGVRSVTLTDIAEEVGIHKSALLRYFETREQIFLELTAAAWLEWAVAVHAQLDGAAIGGVGRVADAVAQSFADRDLLCDLIAHTALDLERNVSTEAVRRYKRTSLAVIADVVGLVGAVLPDLTVDECRDFVRTMASLAGSLWQIANPPAALAELYTTDADLAAACFELTPRLRRIAAILLAGLVPSRLEP